jgi:hypothetical protein
MIAGLDVFQAVVGLLVRLQRVLADDNETIKDATNELKMLSQNGFR